MPSQALTGLNSRLSDVDQLMAAHAAIAGSKPGRKYEVLGINRAAVLMLSAHFEGYLEDLMAESLAAINGALQPLALTGRFHNPLAGPNRRALRVSRYEEAVEKHQLAEGKQQVGPRQLRKARSDAK